jgi:hypothetical protein
MSAVSRYALELLHPAVGATGLVEYRAFVIGHDGHFIDVEPMVCTDDAEAIEKAKRLVYGFAVEIWSGDRLVTRLEANTK